MKKTYLFFLLVFVTYLSQGQIYVNGTGSCAGGLPCYSTIQAAVTAAAAGQTIIVEPGTYNEQVVINKSLTIRSSGGKGVTTWQYSTVADYVAPVIIDAPVSGVTIGGALNQGFTIIGSENSTAGGESAAIYLRGTGAVSNVTISHNTITAGGEAGILTTYNGAGTNLTALTIDNNLFNGTTYVGAPQSGGVFTHPNTPKSAIAVNLGAGNVTITNNTITTTAGDGTTGNYLVQLTSDGSTVNNNIFNGATGSALGRASIRVRGTNSTISCNTFSIPNFGVGTFHVQTDVSPSPYVVATVAANNKFVNPKGTVVGNNIAGDPNGTLFAGMNNITGDTTLCIGDTVQLTFTPVNTPLPAGYTGPTWTSSNTGIATVVGSGTPATTGIVTGVAAGNANIIAAVTSPGGCVTTDTIGAIVAALPTVTVTFSPNDTICQGQSLTITIASDPGSVIRVVYPDNTIITAGTPIIITGSNVQAGVYTYTVTNSNGCTATGTFRIVINPLPTATATATPNPICAGATLQLGSTGGGTYAWGGPASFTSTLQNPSITNIQTTNGGVYTVTVTSPLGCSATASVNVTVNPLPTPTATATPNPICVGATLQLGSTGGGTYAWGGPASFTSTLQNPSIANVQTTNAGVYTVTVTSPQGCSATATVNVTVNPLPTPTATATPNPICVGATLQLGSTGGGTYAWGGPASFTSTLQNPSIANVQTTNAGVYTVTVTSGAGCTATATVNVTVNPLPTPTATATPNPICVGATLQLGSTGGGTYAWGGPATFTSTLQNPSITNVQTTNAGVYTVTVTSPQGCSATATVNVTVNALPTPTATATPNPLCVGATLQLGSTGGGTYAWGGPASFTSTLQNPSITNIQTTNGGVYTVTVTGTSGCTATATVNVTVTTGPTVTITATPNPVCVGATLQLNATGGGTYAWGGPASFTSTLQNPSIANIQTTNGGVYTVTVTGTSGCSATATINVTVGALPTPTATATPNPVCAGTTLQLNATGGGTYSWSGPASFASTMQNPTRTPVLTTYAGIYTVTVTSPQGCSGTATVNVSVNAAPTVTIAATPNPICSGNTLQLTATGGGTYAWSGPGAFTSTLANPTRPNIQTTHSGIYTVTVTTAGTGCTATATVNVIVNQTPVVTISAVTNPICAGKTLILYANGAISYAWSTGATTPSITVTPTTTTTYTVTGTASLCTATASLVVTVNTTPTITINPATADICVNDTINLTAGGGASYKWSTTETTTTIKVHPTQNTTYTVTGTAANGCTNVATSTITVRDFAASVTVVNEKPYYCEGETITMTATGGVSYLWTPGNLSGATVNVKPTVPTRYRVRITGANGCVKYLEVYLDIMPKPFVYINDPKSTTPPPICPGTEIDLRAHGAYSYWWEPIGLPGYIITVAPTSTTRYTVTGSNIWGCTSTASINIPVFAPTSARIESSKGKNPVCIGDTVTLTAIGVTKPKWWPGGQTTNSITLIIKDPTCGTVSGYDANGCEITLMYDIRPIYCKKGGLVDGPDGRAVTNMNVTVSPVPMNTYADFTFETPLQEEAQLTLVTVDGKIVRNDVIAAGTLKYQMNRESLQNGVYIYQLRNAAGALFNTGRIVIME